MHQCTLAVECIHVSVVLSGMGVLSGSWFLHRTGISIIHATLRFVRKIQNIIQNSASPRFVFGLYSVCIRFVFPVQNEGWHVLYTYKISFVAN